MRYRVYLLIIRRNGQFFLVFSHEYYLHDCLTITRPISDSSMYKQTSIILTIDRPTIETASNSRISMLKKISRNRLFSAGHTFYTLGSLREYENTGLSTNVRFDSTTRRVKEAFVTITAEIKKCALWHLRESRRRSVNLKSLFYTHCAHTAITRNRVYANDAFNAINSD